MCVCMLPITSTDAFWRGDCPFPPIYFEIIGYYTVLFYLQCSGNLFQFRIRQFPHIKSIILTHK